MVRSCRITVGCATLNTAITKYHESISEITEEVVLLYGWRNYFFSNMLYIIQLKGNTIMKHFQNN
jgi:hypothetical protein